MDYCVPAGKTRSPRKTQAVSYQYLDRDFITVSRQEAAIHRSRCHARANTLPKIAVGRSIRSAKILWEDYECVEVQSRVQTENEKQPEVLPLRVPKNPRSLYKHPAKPVEPFHILHSPSDYGVAKHRLRELYAQVTYLTNAVRNCDGSASYKGMCKRQRSYHSQDNNPLCLHWPSSDDSVPIPRLLLPVKPGTNTKWYSWKVDTPTEEAYSKGKGQGAHLRRRHDKRVAASAPVSRSLDFLERYGKNISHLVFTVDDTDGRWSKNSTDSKSRDGHLDDTTVGETEVTKPLASSSLSSIVKHDANKFKLKEHEEVAGKAIFLTQSETKKMSGMRKVHADVAGVSCHGDEEEKEERKTMSTTDNEEIERQDEGVSDKTKVQSSEDVAETKSLKNVATDEPQISTQDAVASQDLRQNTKLTEQVVIGTVNELAETDSDNAMPQSSKTPSVTMATDVIASNYNASEEPGNVKDVDNETREEENAPDNEVEKSPENLDSRLSQDMDSSCAVEEDNGQTDPFSGDSSKKTPIKEQSVTIDT